MQKNIYDILVSIIIPVYNVEEYLEDCLKSVVEQTFLDKEVILIDDGSSDSSGTICDNYSKKYSYIRTIHKENGGLSSARNRGIEEANGEYVIFIDSDDYWTQAQTLEHLIGIAESTNADVVRGEHKEVDEAGKDLYTPTIPNKLHLLENKPIDNSIFLESILSRGQFSWLFLFRKTAIGDLRFDIKQRFQEDVDFNIKFFSTSKICVYTSFRFYAYRKRANSIMSTPNINNLRYSFQLSSTWYDYAQRIADKQLKSKYLYNSIMMYYWTLETISSDIYYNQRRTIIKELSLDERQQQILNWAQKDRVSRYPIHIYMKPQIGVILFRHINIIKREIIKQVNKIKRTICRWK